MFPETVVPYYPYFSFITPAVAMGPAHLTLYEQAVTVPGATTHAVAAAAREHGVVVVLGVNERDHGTLYNTQLVFDADGALVLKRRKITPTYHERMVWGQGDGSGLKTVDTAVGRLGALACWVDTPTLVNRTWAGAAIGSRSLTQRRMRHWATFAGRGTRPAVNIPMNTSSGA